MFFYVISKVKLLRWRRWVCYSDWQMQPTSSRWKTWQGLMDVTDKTMSG